MCRNLKGMLLVVAVGCFVVAGRVIAAVPVKQESTEFSYSASVNNEDLLTGEERSLAKRWNLTKSDWLKYKKIMKGPRGVWSPGIDPLTALGVEEEDPQERKRYARIMMQMEIERVGRELAFEMARAEVGRELTEGQLAINNLPWKQEWRAKQSAVNKKVLMFVDVDCEQKCKKMMREVRASIGVNSRLDIYISGAETELEIGGWASAMGIDPGEVRARKITLNFDKGESTQMGVSAQEKPVLRVIKI